MDVKTVVKNASALAVASVLAKAISAVVGILVTRYLGPESYGSYNIAYSYVGTFVVFAELGISQLMVQECSRNEELLPKYFGNTLLFKILMGLIIYVLMLLLMQPAGYSPIVKRLIMIAGLGVVINAVCQSVYNYYQARQQMAIAAVYQFFTTFLIAALTLAVIWGNAGLQAIMAVQLLSYITISFLLYHGLRGKIRPWPYLAELPNMVWRGLPFGVHRIFYNIYFQISILLLPFLGLNEKDVGIYSAPYKLVWMLIFLPSMLTSAVYPILYQQGIADRAEHQKTIEKMFKMLAGVGVPGSVLLCVLAEPFTLWLFGEAFLSSVPVMMVISWLLALECLSFSLGDVLTTTDRQWMRTLVQGAGLLALCVFLPASMGRYGLLGISFTVILVEILIFFGYYILVKKNVYRVRLWRQLPVISLGAVVMAAVAWILKSVCHPLLVSVAAGVIYLGFLVLLDKDFRLLGNYIGNKVRRQKV